jgi:RNA-directed DNA polymerase
VTYYGKGQSIKKTEQSWSETDHTESRSEARSVFLAKNMLFLQAEMLKRALTQRFKEVGLKVHPEKMHVVYCKDTHRRGKYKKIQFDFLGYSFRPRKAMDKIGRCFANYLPAVSMAAKREIFREIRSWHIQLKSEKSLFDISRMFNSTLRGWMNYYGKFNQYGMRLVWNRFNIALMNWLMRKYKDLLRHK